MYDAACVGPGVVKVCMFVWVCVLVYICMYGTYIKTNMPVLMNHDRWLQTLYKPLFLNIYIYIYIYIFTCIYACIYIHTHMHVYTQIQCKSSVSGYGCSGSTIGDHIHYLCIHTTHVCMHTYIYIYTHAHTMQELSVRLRLLRHNNR